MQEDFDSEHGAARAAVPTRLEMLDVRGAILLAEKAAGSRVWEDADGFGAALSEASAVAEKGERVALVAPAERVATCREAMRKAASARLGVVVHALSGHGADELPALADLGWGVLSASGPQDAFDLTLVARRAAEDSGVPFLVVHALARAGHAAGRAVAAVSIPQERALPAFIGASPRPKADVRGTPGDRAFAERVPFALGSALRDYGAVSGRRHDAFEKLPSAESPLVLVGTGPVGDALVAALPELRARGYDVSAIHVAALRPFPGPRLVKALARALAVTVLEPADEPFAHGALLARDVKSAFTDALTWVPGFPGIGRIPKLFVGATGAAFDISDLAAVCENMLADERGRRIFTFTDVEHTLPRAPRKKPDASGRDVAMRFVLDDAAAADAILALAGPAFASGLGLKTHGIVTTTGAAAILDLVASRDGARGGMARRVPRIVFATARGLTSAGAIVPLHDTDDEQRVVGLLGADASGAMPDVAHTVIREQRARVIPLATGDEAGAAVAAALGAAATLLEMPLDSAAAAKLVGDSALARRAFDATRDGLSAGSTTRPVGIA